ncbi:hypothetical protein P43SY_007435 [Pythium insidiosum]|uniref:Transmembrane protein n=1 Tax=Pythium insidiosum TaxID=114742 RepID=A0AAD5LDG8_PYTIN|nr:hypothetical protein P43SY_007435 [Pythium insidiosum]
MVRSRWRACRSNVSSATRLLTAAWVATQVELHGHYSATQLLQLVAYQHHASWRRVLAVCLLTPLPSLALVTLVDLVPLSVPSDGAGVSFWVRATVSVLVLTLSVLHELRVHLPAFVLGRWAVLSITAASTAASIVTLLLLARGVGFPVPFAMLAGAAPWTLVLVGLLHTWSRQHAPHGSMSADLRRYGVAFLAQVSMTLVYPGFAVLYTTLSSAKQTAAVFALPVLKLALKNVISRWLPEHADDARPEAVVFSVEVFHALFVAFTLQKTTSLSTVAVLMALDVGHAWLSFYDVFSVLGSLDLAHRPPWPQLMAVATETLAPMRVKQEPGGGGGGGGGGKPLVGAPATALVWPVALASQAPAAPRDATRQLDAAGRHAIAQSMRQLLYITEYVALTEYTEVMIPLLLNAMIMVLFYLPNRAFYPFLDGMTVASMTTTEWTIALYAALELVSFVAMAAVLWWRVRVSLAHQLAFVLEARQASIQAKLFAWVVFVIQCSIVHFGADYSFQFTWL